jgi:hypothetical protein
MRKPWLAVLILVSCPLIAQPVDCSDGVRHDDGTFETGVGWQTFASRGHYVMRVDPPSPGRRVEAVCLCWLRSFSSTDNSIFFDLRVWDSDGPGGSPGRLLGKLPLQSATGIGPNGKFFRYDLTSLGIFATGPVYIGPDWSPSDDEDFFVCMDESSGTSKQPAYGSSSIFTTDPPSSQLGVVGFFPTYRALGIRAKFGESVATCIPSDTALCLNHGRFKVEATFQAAGQPPGIAKVVKLTDETGYLWFFSSVNVEAVIKVIDACSFNQRFWVYAGGLTDVQVTLTVTDTKNGTVRTYTNPQATKFQPIQDSSAFATCP